MKRMIALVLSLVMALSLCAPAWAEPTTEEAALQAALNAGGTVTLSGDVTVNDGLTVPAGVTVVLDLNGKTITAGSDEYVINNGSGSTLTINDTAGGGVVTGVVYTGTGSKTIVNGGTYNAVSGTAYVFLNNSGSLTINDATVNGGSSYPIYSYNDGHELIINDVTVNGIFGCINAYAKGNVVVNGGKFYFTGVQGKTSHIVYVARTTTMTINDGTFKKIGDISMSSTGGGGICTNGSAVITINGGTFEGDYRDLYEWSTDSQIIVKGGTYAYNPTSEGAEIAEGSTATQNNDGTWTVTTPPDVAEVGGVGYKTLQAALDVGGEVKLLENISLTNTVKITADKTVTLDLNGKVIDGVDAVRIAVMSYGNLTLKDSSADKTGAIKAGIGTAGNAVNICGGSFVMENGTIYSKNNAILIDEEAATITIKGGKITAEPTTNNSAAFYISSTSDTVLNIEGGEMVGFNGILLWNNTTINMTGGSIDAQGDLGIQGNGSRDNTEINISGNATISGKDAAIYHPQGGKLNIKDNAQLSGGTGIVVKGGTINISGGTISGNGAAAAYVPVSSGYQGTGDGLYVEHYDNGGSENYGTPVVTVTGGKFSSVNGKAVASYANPNNDVEALTAFISGGYFTEDPSAYCVDGYTGVTSDKAGYLYMVGEKKATAAEVDVAAPVVSADKVDTTNTTVNNVVNTIGGTNGVEIDTAALTAVAVGTANENKVTPTVQQAEALNDLPSVSGATVSNVAIVVQTYFDVEIEEVKVDETTDKTTSITVDITPMQQTVATTENVVDSNADIKVGENAVKVGNPAPVKITEPVDITLKLPSTCFAVGDKVYITHQASVGTVIYEATVAADYTITFTTTHGFSPFTISVSDPGVKASIGTDNYADLQSAINYAGKDATIVVKASGESAVVKSETSFTVTTESGVTPPTISAGAGYKMVKEDVAGGVKYTFTKVTGGYYYPTTSDKLVESAKTADPIALYIGVTALATLGSALLLKKKED